MAWAAALQHTLNKPPPSRLLNFYRYTELATKSSSAVVHAGKWQGEGEEPSVGSLFVLLEENKASLGLEFYSVSVSTFDEIFLKVVKKHGVGEEDHAEVAAWKKFVLYLRDVVVRLPFM